jgi:cytochrome c553
MRTLINSFRVLAFANLTAFATLGHAIEIPAWAYPTNPPDAKTKPDDGKLHRVPGSKLSLPLAQTRNFFYAPDWHPNDHGPMPDIVAKGRAPDVYACGFCHRANGQGGPENANIAGLSYDYIVQQLRDYRSGARTSALPERLPQKLMIAASKKLTDDEIKDAAKYFSSIKPQQNIRVIETDTVPKPVVANWTWVIEPETKQREPIGKRIVEVPEHLEDFELRDARATFITYVPTGSLKRGEALVTGKLGDRTSGCTACHGTDLRGTAIAPPLAGRSASYATRQLYEFKSATRAGTGAVMMEPIIESLDADDLRAIVAYLASLAP